MTTDQQNLETWRNGSAGRFVFKRFDRMTGRDVEEMVGSGRSISMTPDERRRYEAECANDDLNPFRNGILQAVKLIDTEEDAREIAENVNNLSESDIDDLFASHWKVFEKKVSEVSSPHTLARIKQRAVALDATVKQVATIDARIREVNPEPGPDIETETVGHVGASSVDGPAAPGTRPLTA